jgi:hypothetical protein
VSSQNSPVSCRVRRASRPYRCRRCPGTSWSRTCRCGRRVGPARCSRWHRAARPGPRGGWRDDVVGLCDEARVGLGPGPGDDALVDACRGLHRHPELHEPGPCDARWPDVGEARSLGHAPDHLADLAAPHERQRDGSVRRPSVSPAVPSAAGKPGRGLTERSTQFHPGAPQVNDGGDVGGRIRCVAGPRTDARQLRLPLEPALRRQLRLPLIGFPPGAGDGLPGVCRSSQPPHRTITWRIATPSWSRSKPSFTSSRRNVPVIRRSTGNLPRRYSSM